MIISFVNCHNVAHGDIVKLLINKKKSRIINLITVSGSIPVVIYMKDSEENNRIALTIIASFAGNLYKNIIYISTNTLTNLHVNRLPILPP